MSAASGEQEDVSIALSAGLLSYWSHHQVSSSDTEGDTVVAIMFFELGQTLVRTDDFASADAIEGIWYQYATTHPLYGVGEEDMMDFITGSVTASEYVNFYDGIFAALGVTSPGTTSGVATYGPVFDACIKRCKKTMGCDPGPLSQLICGGLCTIPCLIENVGS